MFDLLIKNGCVIDGSGNEGYTADIGIKDGKISKIGSSLSDAKRVIDASGLVITPGFIDSHSHSDNAIFSHPEVKEKCEQGITTAVGGQCGSTSFPSPTSEDERLRTAESYFNAAESTPQGSNLITFVGHGAIRRAVMQHENRRPTPDELEKMKELVREAVRHGAIGLSFGLIYIPGTYAETDELIELAKVCAEEGGMLSAHIRNEANKLIEAVEEFITIVKASGARGVISHHKSCYEQNYGKVKKTLEMIDAANSEGYDIYCDVYPYLASSTSLSARFIPKEYMADRKTLENLANPETREKIRQSFKNVKAGRIDWVLVNHCAGHPEYHGKYVCEIADEMGCDDVEAALRIIELSNVNATACYFSMCEDDVKTVISYPRAMICTDSSVVRSSSSYHPRLRASFPRAIRRFVRELKVVSLPEMIRKMTSLPASVYNLGGKGLIKEGYDADICVFDAEKICDMADFVHPERHTVGLNYVIAGGEVIAEDSVYTGAKPGKVIRAR